MHARALTPAQPRQTIAPAGRVEEAKLSRLRDLAIVLWALAALLIPWLSIGFMLSGDGTLRYVGIGLMAPWAVAAVAFVLMPNVYRVLVLLYTPVWIAAQAGRWLGQTIFRPEKTEDTQTNYCPECGARPRAADQLLCDACAISRMHQH